MRLIALVLLAALFPGLAQGETAKWPLEALNRQVDQTNFRVGRGCSGTLISVERKLILTNEHCVQSEVRIVEVDEIAEDGTVKRVKRQIRLPTVVAQTIHDDIGRPIGGRESRVEIVRVDADADLALLRMLGPLQSSMAAPILPPGRKITRGERVYIVGNPAGHEASVVSGEISNLRRELPEFPSRFGRPWEVMQVSGGMWGGNSGGALFNSEGYLIGVPAAGNVRASFIGFAVPIDVIHRFLASACHADLFGGDNASNCPAR